MVQVSLIYSERYRRQTEAKSERAELRECTAAQNFVTFTHVNQLTATYLLPSTTLVVQNLALQTLTRAPTKVRVHRHG